MKNVFFCFLLVLSITTNATRIDSLTNLMDQSTDSVKLDLYQELILEYQDIDFVKSIELSKEALDFAASKNNERWKAKIYIITANVYHKKSNYEKSVEYYLKAKEILFETADTPKILTICNNLGTTYTDMGDYVNSQALLYEGLKIAEESKSKNDIARISNNIGLNYYFQEDFQKALTYYEKALTIKKEEKDKNGVALAYNNIGIVYYFLGDLEMVVDYFHKALTIYEELGDIRGQSLPLYNIAEIYYEQERYHDALKYYNKSLEIDKKVGDKSSIAMGYYSIGNVLVELGRYNEAIEKQLNAIKIAEAIKAKPVLAEGYLHLSTTYEKLDNYEESLKYFKLYHVLKDSIYDAEKASQIADITSKYENEKKEEQIELLEKEKELKDFEIKNNINKIRNQRIFLLITFIALIIIVIAAILLFRQKHLKQEMNNLLLEKNQELEIANQEIQKTTKEKEKFFANTSHELRNPLNVVIGFTNLLLKTDLDDKQKNYLTNIKKSGNNLLVVINDLLTHFKIEAGKLKLEYVDFDIKNEIKNQVEFAKQKALLKTIEIKVEINDNMPDFVNGDPVRFSQILSNLLSNAIKFTDFKGKILVKAKLLKQTQDNIILKFSVIDNGIGIAENKLKEIFESFTQADYDTTRKFGGTGLGLAIVKSLVELQGGEITVFSEINKGSEFIFNIVFNTCKFKDNATTTKKKSISPNLRNSLKILIVEDDPVNIVLAEDTFALFDKTIEVDSALNGKLAIEKIQLNDFDVIIMDIQMPVMDGYQTTKFIRNNLPSPKNNIPILGMSAYAMKEEVDLCFKYGMNDYITKPFSPEELFEKIRTVSNIDLIKEKAQNIVQIEVDKNLIEYPVNLLKIYGNNKSKIDKILLTFLEEIPKKINQLNSASIENNPQKLKLAAHSLKTSLKLIGEMDAAELCLKIELAELDQQGVYNAIKSISTIWKNQKVYLEKLCK